MTDRQPRSRKSCPHGEATPDGCRSREWPLGRWCCGACPAGDYDQEANPMTGPVWVECVEVACANGIAVHWRHVRDFEDRYHSHEHEEQ